MTRGHINQYYQKPSLAESVLQSNKGKVYGIPTRRDKATGVEYPYDTEYDFTSRSAIGFRGCFICGGGDLFSRGNFPKGDMNPAARKLFFNEMWSHKPHTKKRLRDGTPVSITITLFLTFYVKYLGTLDPKKCPN